MQTFSLDEIERRARAGDVQAQAVLLDWLRSAAATGSPDANRALAQVLLTRPPYALAEAAAAVLAAAKGGDADAAHCAAMLAGEGYSLPQDWHAALDHLQRAAELGSARAWAELVALAKESALALAAADGRAPPDVWRQLRNGIDIEAWLAVPPAHMLAEGPRIGVVEGFLPEALCDWLIARAAPDIARAQTIDKSRGDLRDDDSRSNSAMNFNLWQSDLLLLITRARLARVLGRAPGDLEATAVLHYSPGEYYREHFDFLDPALPGYAREVAARGQRIATFLVYLNDGFAGGETDFPELALRYKGAKGDALFFWNVDEAGAPERRTRHAGLAPSQGEKWLLSNWVRDRSGALFGPVLPALA
jgi:prolyl 4-hydroxylase